MFQPLETGASRHKSFIAGWGVQITAVLILFGLNAMFPKALPQASRYIATNLVLTPAPVPQEPQVRMKRMSAPIQHPVIVAQETRPRPTVEEVTPPHMPPQTEVQAFNNQPVVPAPVVPRVEVNKFSSGSSATQTTHRAAIEVQTGGFGDPNGIPAKAGKGVPNIAAVGRFDLPEGSGSGNGLGGKHPGVTASTGFGNGAATGSPTGRHVEVTSSNFDNHLVEEKNKPAVVQTVTTPAQILSKPIPTYSEEGRRMKIEGIVRVQVRLTAIGKVEVLNVLSGLGHGLDEQAVAVVKQIKFKPAQQEGHDTDSTVTLSIIFQLAS